MKGWRLSWSGCNNMEGMQLQPFKKPGKTAVSSAHCVRQLAVGDLWMRFCVSTSDDDLKVNQHIKSILTRDKSGRKN